MANYTFKILCRLFFACFFCHVTATAQKRTTVEPNIVVIMVDDLGYSDIGYFGSEINTPNIDRLAINGLSFRNFYNAGRCCPSRASLLSGLYPHQAGMGGMVSEGETDPDPGPYQGYLTHEYPSMAQQLKKAGYKTFMSGKWHVGERPQHWPLKYGFDKYFGLISGASSYFEIIKEKRTRKMVHNDTLWTPPDSGFYMTDAIADTAAAYINGHQASESPFFLYIAFTAPHWPLHAMEEDVERYEGIYDNGWDVIREKRFSKMKESGLLLDSHQITPVDEHIPSWEDLADKGEWTRKMQVYAAMVDRMDQGVGRILDALEDEGVLENTVIFFLSDNGGSAENIDARNLHQDGSVIGQKGSYVSYDLPWANVSNTPYYKYKSWTHEGGIITPLIVHWPEGIKRKGTVSSYAGHIVDIAATSMDLAGINDKNLEGESLQPLFTREFNNNREIYWEHFGKKAMRKGNWKIVNEGGSDDWHLFDLYKDPTEMIDLSAQYPETLNKLIKKYNKWSKRVGVIEE